MRRFFVTKLTPKALLTMPVPHVYVFALLLFAGFTDSVAAPKPLKVFILAGQSNMEGQAVVDLEGKDYNQGQGTLATLMRDPAKAPMFKHLKDAPGPMGGAR